MDRTWIGILALLGVALPATAAQQSLTPEQAATMAAWIVDAEVTSSEVRWTARGRRAAWSSPRGASAVQRAGGWAMSGSPS